MEEEELVYDERKGQWHPPSKCIWAENRIHLPGMISLATTYKSNAAFFLQTLKIKKPDMIMHINALITRSLASPDKKIVIQEILNICALNPNPEVVQTTLANCACFPVRNPSGEIQ